MALIALTWRLIHSIALGAALTTLDLTDPIVLIVDTMKSVDLVQVLWSDACQVRSPKDAKALRMMSFGFLLQNDKRGVVLAQSQSEVGEFVDCLVIPRGMVLEVAKIPVPVGQGSIEREAGDYRGLRPRKYNPALL